MPWHQSISEVPEESAAPRDLARKTVDLRDIILVRVARKCPRHGWVSSLARGLAGISPLVDMLPLWDSWMEPSTEWHQGC